MDATLNVDVDALLVFRVLSVVTSVLLLLCCFSSSRVVASRIRIRLECSFAFGLTSAGVKRQSVARCGTTNAIRRQAGKPEGLD